MRSSRIPKARIFVVNEDTLKDTIQNKIVSVKTPQPTGEQWLKTIADIAADMLQIEKGDYIFLWATRSETSKSEIYGVFRAISSPYYEMNSTDDEYPFKIRIEYAYEFDKPITEYDVLNNPFSKKVLWNIVGKKVAGKSRASSPLTFDEVQHLIQLLIGKNENYRFSPYEKKRFENVRSPLCINLSNKVPNKKVRSLRNINPNALSYVDSDNNVRYEKILETLFNQEMSKRNKIFFRPLEINVDEVVWFSNYLPYSIERSEIDYFIMTSLDGLAYDKLYLIEFQKTSIDKSHIQRTLLYTKWINETLALGESIAQPILICFNSPDFSKCRKENEIELQNFIGECEKDYKSKKMKIFTYSIENGQMHFERKR